MVTELRRPNILAVDDYEANLTALQAVLGAEYNLTLAKSGPEAISILESRNDIDVILMDVQMPDMDGFEAAAKIKQIDSAKEIPIIFITAVYKEEPFVKKGYQAGGIDYFSKPFDPDVLKLKINVYASFRQRSTILKERERQIKETEELLRVGRKLSNVLECLPVGVLIADVHGRICQINEQVSRICENHHPANPDSYGEMLGWWDEDGKMITRNGPLTKALYEGKTSHSDTIQITCKHGARKSILCSASPLLGLDGRIVGAVVLIQDVTEHKKIGEDLESRITKLVSAGVEIEETINH